MTEIYFNSFSANYLRPSYPIDLGRSQASAQALSPYAAALTAGMASITRTAGERAAQPTFADGFVWLLKVLTNRLTRGTGERRADVAPAPTDDPAKQRIQRLLREAPQGVEA
jgi:hypothetical protein